MPVEAVCTCGATYSLRDEFASQMVQCPRCGKAVRAGDKPGSPPTVTGDPVFARDQFLLRQKHLSISEKYYVWDDVGQAILFIERPAHLLRNVGAALAGILAAILVGTVFGVLASVMTSEGLRIAFAAVAVIGALAALFVVAVGLSRKRDVKFYRDDSKRELVLQVFQDKKIAIIHATYTIADAAGSVLGKLDKNYLYNIIRKRWYCRSPEGQTLCLAKEDSIILSLLRRLIGPFFGLLRTNFVILAPEGDRVLGEFNRKFTILDRYVLNLSGDANRSLDRRIALALGVMLDTGERR